MPFIKTSQLKTISKCLRQMNEGFLDWYSEYQRKFVDNETINESMYEKQMLLESLRESMTVLSEIEQEHKKYNDYCREYQRVTRSNPKARVSRNAYERRRRMTKHEADVIGGLNMTDQISNEAYKQIMIAAQDENEPCEDAISRQAVLNILDDMVKDYIKENDFDKAQGVAWVNVQKLPPVTPQQMTGHWIDGVCSECGWDAGQEAFSEDANFCMKCGVKMLPIGAESEG